MEAPLKLYGILKMYVHGWGNPAYDYGYFGDVEDEDEARLIASGFDPPLKEEEWYLRPRTGPDGPGLDRHRRKQMPELTQFVRAFRALETRARTLRAVRYHDQQLLATLRLRLAQAVRMDPEETQSVEIPLSEWEVYTRLLNNREGR